MAIENDDNFKGMISNKSLSSIYWCPAEFDEGIKAISECVYLCEKELSQNVCSLIAEFVIGEKWPINVSVKCQPKISQIDFYYETISVNPNEMGQAVYREYLKKQINHFGSQGMVLLNRSNARKLIRYKTLLEQNIANGTKFEATAAFKGKGRLYNMW